MKVSPAATPPAVDWRRIVLPAEHGGWAFLGEPLVLGLAVAPSWAGGLIALAALAGFLARQPLRLALGDRRRGKRYPRTVAAGRALAALAVIAALALAGALMLARGPVMLALGLAAPLAALALAYELAQRPRALASELAGALALAATATAVALAGGTATALAFGLWGVLAARVVPSVVFVRARLRLDRDEPAPVAAALVLQVVGVAAAAALARAGLAPWAGAGAIALLAARALFGLSPWRVRSSVQRFGIAEVGFGLVVVVATALGARASLG